VLNGSTGSSFLYGGTGKDTFFVDDRNPPADSSIWSTVVISTCLGSMDRTRLASPV
jgi:hypothetical protein